jgi:hypothetical protein
LHMYVYNICTRMYTIFALFSLLWVLSFPLQYASFRMSLCRYLLWDMLAWWAGTLWVFPDILSTVPVLEKHPDVYASLGNSLFIVLLCNCVQKLLILP